MTLVDEQVRFGLLKVLEGNMNSHIRQLRNISMIASELQKLMEEALLES